MEDIEGKENAKRKRLEQDKIVQRILKYKRQGISDRKIADMKDVNKGQTLVSKYVRECIQLGLITGEEIEEAKKKRKEDKKNNDPDRIRVLEGLKRGETDIVISKDTTVKHQQVKNIRLELIQEGLITQEEINLAREKAKSEQQNKDIVTVPIDKEQLMTYLVLGYDVEDIKRKHGKLDIKEYNRLVNELVKEGRITKVEIREYRERKKEEDKEKILRYLKLGFSQRKITQAIDSTLTRVQNYIKKIKVEQNITDEDILNWKLEQEDSLANKKNAVLEGLKRGLSISETIKEYPKQKLSEADVKNYRLSLIEEGAITQDEVVDYRNLRKKEEIPKLSKFQKVVLDYLKQGYTAREIIDATR